MNNQENAPVFDALMRFKNHLSLHVPGHKHGQDFDLEGFAIYKDILSLDQTEIEGLDDLHQAEGVIHEAERLAAQAFGSEETKFLVGGTTAGILALLLAVIGEGDKCLIERNSHKSVYNGLRLAKGVPVFLPPRIEEETGVPFGADCDAVEAALRNDRTIKAVFLTSPNYYGRIADISAIAKVSHKYGVPLFIDEAHGAHYRFSERLPLSALEQGADAVVQSTHKTLSAMTMSSMIHFQGDRFDRKRVKMFLAILQSSSPSYPLLASLDLARRYMMVGAGRRRLEQAIDWTLTLREKLSSLHWLRVITNDDPLRLVIQLPLGCSRTLQLHLQQNNIHPEIVEPNRMVFVFSGGNHAKDYALIRTAFDTFRDPTMELPLVNNWIATHLWTQVLNEATDLESVEWCRLDSSVGRVAAGMLIPYPPGIPFVLERQILTIEVVQALITMEKEGFHIQGVENERILVYASPS